MIKIAFILFRVSIALIFIYFGFLAVSDPVVQAAIWLPASLESIIVGFIPITWFMIIFGVTEMAVGLGIIFQKFYKTSLLAAACMLVGIVLVIGIVTQKSGGGYAVNEIALRDIVVLMGVIYLLAEEMG